jgi:Arc/MetJ-type ribon-helix-helix transcriptional regulator
MKNKFHRDERRYKMKQKYVLGIIALSMVALLGAGMISAFGFRNGVSEEDREALKNAVESGNYESWAELKRAQISEERFEEVRARHQERQEFRTAMQEARESGDYSKLQELKAEFGKGKGMQRKNMNSGDCPFSK